MCSACNRQPAHPCYGTRCEDCWADSMELTYSHHSIDLAYMVHSANRCWKQETGGFSGAYKHWQGRIFHKAI